MHGFLAFSAVMGFGFALLVYAVTVFAVARIYLGRVDLVTAVGGSVRALFKGFVAMTVWALLLSASTIVTLMLFVPAFAFLFPLFAYASAAAHRQVFPDTAE